MSVAYRMPVHTELAKRVGPKLWRKTILRAGHISKGGVELDVDRPYLDTLLRNFTAGAMDSVPFQLADAANAHNADPERTRGRLQGLELTADDQLVGIFETTPAGAELLTANPKLGASVSIDPAFQRADGRKYGPTLLHVCGTLDPEVSRLGDWAGVHLSAGYDQVIDFTAPSEGDAPRTPTPAAGGQQAPTQKEEAAVPAPALTDEELAAVRSVLPIFQKAVDAAADAMDPDAEPVDDRELVSASADTSEALNLANARIDAQAVELARLQAERDLERYEAEKLSLAKDFGIPSAVTELARPLLLGGGRKVELSAGTSVDAGQIIRKVLHELGRRYAKALDLGAEYGTADAVPDQERHQRELTDWVAVAAAQLQGK